MANSACMDPTEYPIVSAAFYARSFDRQRTNACRYVRRLLHNLQFPPGRPHTAPPISRFIMTPMLLPTAAAAAAHAFARHRRIYFLATGGGVLFTGVYFDVLLTRVALHTAAPMEPAATPFADPRLCRFEAATAAHQLAAVHPGGCPVARPAARARRPGDRIGVAEVARLVDVDEVFARRSVELPVALNEPRTLPVERHLRGAVVSVA
jgi:hypothetical protein